MKKNALFQILAWTLALSGAAQAQTMNDAGNYGEIGFSHVNLSGPGGSSKPHGARLVFGNHLNKNLALEGMYTMNTTKEARDGYDASFNGLGILLKPKIALTDNTDLFARVGVMFVDLTASNGGSHKGTDMAWGLGMQTNFTNSMYGQLDYMRSYDRESFSAKGYTLSLGFRF